MRMIAVGAFVLLMLAIDSPAVAEQPDHGQLDRDRRFIKKMTGSRVLGSFVVTKGQRPEEFQALLEGFQAGMRLRITKVERLTPGNPANWRFVARLRTLVGTFRLEHICPVKISKYRDIQWIHIHTFFVPGCGNIGGHVYVVGNRFSGTWCTGNHSGTMQGRLKPRRRHGHGHGYGADVAYWQDPENRSQWQGFQADNSFETVFGVSPGRAMSLADALQQPGGETGSLLSQSVTALLNAAHPEMDSEYSQQEVIQLVQDAFATGDFQAATMLFEKQNATDSQ